LKILELVFFQNLSKICVTLITTNPDLRSCRKCSAKPAFPEEAALFSVLWIRYDFLSNTDPDPTFQLVLDPDPVSDLT
jgi:hypothetical protein